MNSRTRLRSEIRGRRNALPAREQGRHARALARRFIGSPLFLRCHSLAAYLANDGEIDPSPLLERARDGGKRLYLPVLRPRPSRALWFAEHDATARLLPNRFGIPEPDIRRHPPRPPWGLDLVLVPLVAFDSACNRLGPGPAHHYPGASAVYGPWGETLLKAPDRQGPCSTRIDFARLAAVRRKLPCLVDRRPDVY